MPMEQPDELDVDRLLWRGFEEVTPIVNESAPQGRDLFDVGTFEPPPESFPPYASLFLRTQCPPWQCPGYWSVPLDRVEENCIPFYEVDQPVLNYKTQDINLAVVTGVSYEFPQNALVDGDIIEVRLLRNGAELARWEDYVVGTAAANPNDRFFFSSHIMPFPIFNARFDINDQITVTIKVRGQLPFTQTPADVLNVNFKVLLRGWSTKLRDTRQGGPKYLTDFSKDIDPTLKDAEKRAAEDYQKINKVIQDLKDADADSY